MKKIILILLTMMFQPADKKPDLPVVSNLEITKYLGTWYEIARLPNSFEKNLDRVSATYSLKENGKIKVENQGFIIGSVKFKRITGTAWIPDKNITSKLKVRFFWPFAGNYWVISIDANYKYALVGDPSRKFLWILAREKSLDENIILSLLETAQKQGFDTPKVIRVNQK